MKSRLNGLLLKLEFEKTCNMVNWECLLEVLKARGFRQQ